MDRISSVIEQFIAAEHITGAAVRVCKKDGILFDGAYGFADLEKKLPVRANTMYRLCSMSKPITGICVMKLVEEGKLCLNDPIAAFVPSIKDMQVAIADESGVQQLVPLNRDITVYDCLTHSSGIGTGALRCGTDIETVSMGYVMSKLYPGMSLAERANLYAQGPADFQPGDGTGYSALMAFDMLVYVIECVSGMDFSTYLRKEITEPMGIQDLTFMPDEDQCSRMGPIVGKMDGKLFDDTKTSVLWQLVDPVSSGYHSGSGGLIGSLEAYSSIAKMLLGGGLYDGVRILKEETVRMMRGIGIQQGLRFEEEAYWGLSVAVFDRPWTVNRGLTPNSYGWSGAFGTHFYIDPEQELAVTLMTCGTHLAGADSDVSWAVERAVYEMFCKK